MIAAFLLVFAGLAQDKAAQQPDLKLPPITFMCHRANDQADLPMVLIRYEDGESLFRLLELPSSAKPIRTVISSPISVGPGDHVKGGDEVLLRPSSNPNISFLFKVSHEDGFSGVLKMTDGDQGVPCVHAPNTAAWFK